MLSYQCRWNMSSWIRRNVLMTRVWFMDVEWNDVAVQFDPMNSPNLIRANALLAEYTHTKFFFSVLMDKKWIFDSRHYSEWRYSSLKYTAAEYLAIFARCKRRLMLARMRVLLTLTITQSQRVWSGRNKFLDNTKFDRLLFFRWCVRGTYARS